MTNTPTLFIADDHPLLLKGLIDELKSHNYDVIGTATNGASALEMISSNNPDIAILDIEMPLLNGLEVIKKCKEKGIMTKFIIFTSYKESQFIFKAKSLNISGYLLKDEPFEELQKCINAIKNNKTYFSTTFNSIFENKVSPEITKLKLLSPSERTIIRLIAQGKTSNEISELLFISTRTVQKHRTNIINKLDLDSSADALKVWATSNKELLSTI